MKKRLYWSLCGLAAAVAALLIWISTPWGIGTQPDSIQYILGARKLAQGGSPFELTGHWPPLYPMLLAVTFEITNDNQVGLRLLHALLYAMNVILVARCVAVGEAKVSPFALACVVAATVLPQMYSRHYFALSEPLFATFILLHLLGLRAYLGSASRRWLYASGLCIGMAILTRYAGLAFVGSTSLFLFLENRISLKSRLYNCVGLVAASLCLPISWAIAAAQLTDAGPPRELLFHPIDLARLIAPAAVVAEWFHSQIIGRPLAILFATYILAFSLWVSSWEDRSTAVRFISLLLLHCFCYVIFLFLSISLFDFYTPIDERTLFPVLIFGMIAAALAGGVALGDQRLGAALAAVIFLFVLGAGLPALKRSLHAHTEWGVGYFSAQVRAMEILHHAKDLDFSRIYSNAPELLNLYFDTSAVALPAFFDPVKNRPVPTFAKSMERMIDELARGQAVIVFFDAFDSRKYYPDREVFEKSLSLPTIYIGNDGAIFAQPAL